jgi:hypothetical protein
MKIASVQINGQGAKVDEVDPNSIEGKIRQLAASGRLARAGRKAIRAQKKLGLATTFKKGNQVIRQHPNGKVEVLEELPRPKYTLPTGVKLLGRK